MEFNQNGWYSGYQTPTPGQGGYPSSANRSPSRKKNRGVRGSTLAFCMVATLLAGCAFGVLYTKSYVDKKLSAIKAEASVATASAAPQLTLSQQSAVQESSFVPSNGGQYAKSQIIELCAPTVVGIDVTETYSGFGYGFQSQSQEVKTGSGSGIILTTDGYIATCNHVVDGAETITVILNDDTSYEAKVVGTDTRNDLAVIKIEASGLSPATLGDSDMLTVGEDVIAIGNPLGELRGTATGGMVSALNRTVTMENSQMQLIQTDAAISPGNSGGGLFNSSGSLIGIVNAKASSSNSEGLGFAIPVNSVKQIISDLMVHGYVRGRAYLGVYTQNVTLSSGKSGWGYGSFFGSYFGSDGTNCVQVDQVVAGSAAEQAGLMVGDLILSVGNKAITSNTDLSDAISGYNSGETATITIQRSGQQTDLSVTFQEYSPTN